MSWFVEYNLLFKFLEVFVWNVNDEFFEILVEVIINLPLPGIFLYENSWNDRSSFLNGYITVQTFYFFLI